MIVNSGVNVTPLCFNKSSIPIIEERYKAKYILETEFYTKSGWSGDLVGLIFYQPNPDLEAGHSNYFIIYKSSIHGIMITNGLDTVEKLVLNCVSDSNGVFEYSHFNHHYHQVGNVAIDGGRLYTRLIGDIHGANQASFKIEEDKLVRV